MTPNLLPFVLILLVAGFFLWSLLQGSLLRGAGAIFNGMSARGGGEAIPEVGLWKSTGIAALAVFVNLLISWFAFTILVRDGGSFSPGRTFLYWLLTQVAALPVSVIVVAALSVLMLPTSFGRAAMLSLIWSGLYLLAGLVFYLLVELLFSANRLDPANFGSSTALARRPFSAYTMLELGIFAVIILLLEVPVFYASTALAGPEPSLLKTFALPTVCAALWGAAAVGVVAYLGKDWLLAPENVSKLIGVIALIVVGSLIVQAVFFTLLLPSSVFSGILTSIFQLLLRLLLYALLLGVNFVFMALYDGINRDFKPASTGMLAPVMDLLAMLT